jgi:23S rRNA pseudouridine1911/1915/1917 synthase
MMEMIYADNHLIVVCKPSGLVTEAEEGESLESQMKQWVKRTYAKPGKVFLKAAHRLDKPVSGLVLLAKTSKALERLQKAFLQREMKKTYLALVEGVLPQSKGRLEHTLTHEEFYAKVSTAPHAKKAILSYQVKKQMEHCALVEIELETGRYHQIRCQMAHIGHPVLNDVKYGARPMPHAMLGSIALHHHRMELEHPVSKKPLRLEKAWDDEAWTHLL